MEERLAKIIKSDNHLLRIFLAEFLGNLHASWIGQKYLQGKILRSILTLLCWHWFNLSIVAVEGNAKWDNTEIEYLLVIWYCSCRWNLHRGQCIRRTYQSSCHNRYCSELSLHEDRLENLFLSQCNFGPTGTWYQRKCKNVRFVFDCSNYWGFLCFSNGLLHLFESFKRHWTRLFRRF